MKEELGRGTSALGELADSLDILRTLVLHLLLLVVWTGSEIFHFIVSLETSRYQLYNLRSGSKGLL